MPDSSGRAQVDKSLRQLLRYGLVGVGVNLTLYCGYLLLNYLGVEPKKSMSLIYLVGAGIGFYGHRQWTFRHGGDALRSIVRYLTAHVLGYIINFFLLFGFVDYFGYPHEVVQGGAIFIVAGFLFVVFKYWVFSANNKYVI